MLISNSELKLISCCLVSLSFGYRTDTNTREAVRKELKEKCFEQITKKMEVKRELLVIELIIEHFQIKFMTSRNRIRMRREI